MSIWKENSEINENPNRNNFDMSFSNHLTLKMGQITPFYCKECIPGDSFDINTLFGLKFQPFNFPVQSKMRAHVSYFYVPNRILWDNWKNFIQGLEEHTHPYIYQDSSFFKTGSLADYLDVPTTLAGTKEILSRQSSAEDGYGVFRQHGIDNFHSDGTVTANTSNLANYDVTGSFLYAFKCLGASDFDSGASWSDVIDQLGSGSNRLFFYESKIHPRSDMDYEHLTELDYFHFGFNGVEDLPTPDGLPCYLVFWKAPKGSIQHDGDFTSFRDFNPTAGQYTDENGIVWDVDYIPDYSQYLSVDSKCIGSLRASSYQESFVYFRPDLRDDYISHLDNFDYDNYDYYVSIYIAAADITSFEMGFPLPHMCPTTKDENYFSGVFYVPTKINEVVDTSDIVSPFSYDADAPFRLRINALPFRAYEAIYWSYFANTQNQPFYVDGVQQFNKYNTTTADGADETPYHLFYRNYEQDFLTSGMPSPQFGIAPQVGINGITGEITIEDENGITTAHADIDGEGNIGKVVITSPLASIEHARTAMNMQQLGMNINDFRNASAYQRFLETTLRKGYKYKDFILGHTGVSPKSIELDMPLYIGGVSQDVNVQSIANMTAGNGVPLGQFAGVANCFGANTHNIRHFCDDFGWIIGVICVVPTPAYSQLLPKHFLYNSQLSYHFNEFSQLGLQPITYEEVCPVQSYIECTSDNTKRMQDTFCYQRPDYHLVANVDQVHGDFRLSRRSSLVNRIFEHRPELGTDFLTINPAEVNDIFAYTDPDSDTIIGQIVCDVKAKRPLPRITIPSLGR